MGGGTHTQAAGEKTQVQLFRETSASAKLESASHPLVEEGEARIEKRSSKLWIRKAAKKEL